MNVELRTVQEEMESEVEDVVFEVHTRTTANTSYLVMSIII